MNFLLWCNKGIISRLRTRFNLLTQPERPDAMPVIMSIQPITNFDELLRTSKIINANLDLRGSGFVPLYTVPAGKRVRLKALFISSVAAAHWSGISDGTNTFSITETGTTQTINNSLDYQCLEGWIIGSNGTANIADSAIPCQCLIEEEDKF